MKLTAKQKKEVLPKLQAMVQAVINAWDAQRHIEGILETSFDGMMAYAECLAVNYGAGSEVRLEDVQDYIDSCREDK